MQAIKTEHTRVFEFAVAVDQGPVFYDAPPFDVKFSVLTSSVATLFF